MPALLPGSVFCDRDRVLAAARKADSLAARNEALAARPNLSQLYAETFREADEGVQITLALDHLHERVHQIFALQRAGADAGGRLVGGQLGQVLGSRARRPDGHRGADDDQRGPEPRAQHARILAYSPP